MGVLKATLEGYGPDPRIWWRNIAWRMNSFTSDHPVIFVVGAPRSGTTLLQTLLQAHRECFGIEGETGLFDWQNLFRKERLHFGLEGDALKSAIKEASGRVDFMDRQIARLATETGRRVFIEKTPQHVMRLRVILRSFPRARIVHITRDGRDGFCSAQSHRNVPQRRSVSAFGHYWRRCVRAGLAFDEDPRLSRIRYEDLASDPEATLRTLVTGLDLEWDPNQLDPMRRGNDARARRTEFSRLGEAISGSRIGRWKNELDEAQQQAFLQIAGRELEILGYEGHEH